MEQEVEIEVKIEEDTEGDHRVRAQGLVQDPDQEIDTVVDTIEEIIEGIDLMSVIDADVGQDHDQDHETDIGADEGAEVDLTTVIVATETEIDVKIMPKKEKWTEENTVVVGKNLWKGRGLRIPVSLYPRRAMSLLPLRSTLQLPRYVSDSWKCFPQLVNVD